MALPHEMAELLESIGKELPERLHDVYEEAVQRAAKQGRKRARRMAFKMVQRKLPLKRPQRRHQPEEGALALFSLIIGLIGGAALMYLFDPDRGAQRRASLREQANRAADDLSNAVEETAQRAGDPISKMADAVKDTSKQVATEAKNRVSDAASSVLVDRVRIEIGRIVRAPGEIKVSVEDGVVTLSGKVLASEAQPLVAKIQAMSGVRSVESHLEVHDALDSPTSAPNDLNTTPGSEK